MKLEANYTSEQVEEALNRADNIESNPHWETLGSSYLKVLAAEVRRLREEMKTALAVGTDCKCRLAKAVELAKLAKRYWDFDSRPAEGITGEEIIKMGELAESLSLDSFQD